jgi:hypothetical protein
LIEEALKNHKVSLLLAGTQMKVKSKPDDNSERDTFVVVGRLDISPATFDPKDPKKRPQGWNTVQRKRVFKKEQLDRLRGVREADIISKRDQRLAEVSLICIF